MDEIEALALNAERIDADALATGTEAILAGAEEQAEADTGANNVAQVALMMALAVPLLGKLYPSIAEIYTEQVQGQVAQSIGPVLSKYGVDLSDMASSYGPEIAAAVICIPLAIATVAGIKADIAARAPKGVKNDTLRASRYDPEKQVENVVLG